MKWEIKSIDNYRTYCYSATLIKQLLYTDAEGEEIYRLRHWLYDNKIPHREHNDLFIWYFETKEDLTWFRLTWTE